MAHDISLRNTTALATSSATPKALQRVFLPPNATVRTLDPFTSQGPWWPEHLSDHPDPEDTAALAVFVDASRGLVQQLSLELLFGVPALQHATAPPLDVSQPHTLHPRTAGLAVRHPDGALSFTQAQALGATTRPHTEPDVFPVRDPIDHFDVESINDDGSATAALVDTDTETRIHGWSRRRGRVGQGLRRRLAPLEQTAPWSLELYRPTSVTWSPDGEQIAVADSRGVLICAVRPDALVPIRRLLGSGITSVAWATFGLATGGRTIRVWDPRQPEAPPVVLTGHTRPVNSVAWSADGRLASGSDDGAVMVWDIQARDALPVVLSGHQDVVTVVAWGSGGRLASGSNDRTVRIWDPSHPDSPPIVLDEHRGRVNSVTWAPDGRIASGSDDRSVRVWDPAWPDARPHIFAWDLTGVLMEGFDPDGSRTNQSITVWGEQDYDGYQSSVRSVAWHRDGRIALGCSDRPVQFWDPRRPDVPPVVIDGHGGSTVEVAWGPDGRLAAVFENRTVLVLDPRQARAEPVILSGYVDERTIRVCDPRRPQVPPVVLHGPTGSVASYAWSEVGRLASGSEDRTVRIREPSQPCTPPFLMSGHTSKVFWVEWHPDGTLLLSASSGVIWQVNPSRPESPASYFEGWPTEPADPGSVDGRQAVLYDYDPEWMLARPTRERSIAVPRALSWDRRRLTVQQWTDPKKPVIALHPFLGTDVAAVLPGSEHVPADRQDAARPARRRVVRADRVATIARGALHLYQPTEAGDVWKATALPGLYPACLAPNVDGDLVLQGPDLRSLEALLDAVPTVPPPAWSTLPIPFRVVDGHLRALGHDVDLAQMAEVRTAAALKDGHWVVAGPDGVLVLVAPDGQHALRFRLRSTHGLRTGLRQLAVVADALVVGFDGADGAEPVRVRLPRFDTPLRVGRGGTTPPAGPRLLAGPVPQD